MSGNCLMCVLMMLIYLKRNKTDKCYIVYHRMSSIQNAMPNILVLLWSNMKKIRRMGATSFKYASSVRFPAIQRETGSKHLVQRFTFLVA